MLLLKLDEKSKIPLYKQIIDEIKIKIENKVLSEGELLPSSRQLAAMLGINRSTVLLAYESLWSMGYIELHRGKKASVRKRSEVAKPENKVYTKKLNWDDVFSKQYKDIRQLYEKAYPASFLSHEDGLIDFSSMTIEHKLFPVNLLKKSFNNTFRGSNQKMLGYGDKKGFLPLRTYIVHHLQMHGIHTTADEIMITHGSQQAINLVLSLFSNANKTIAIESPTYFEIYPLLKFYNINSVEIPLTSNGMDLQFFEKIIKQKKIDVVYTMPNFQNPSGVTTSQQHREKLLALCESKEIPIIEDAFEEEMKYFGKTVMPIKSMDRKNIVFYCGTFSKILFPGLRIGWINADKTCIDILSSLRWFQELSLSTLTQAAIFDFCEKGHYTRHINKMNRIYKNRMIVALDALDKYVSKKYVTWKKSMGGFLLWLALLPSSHDDKDIMKILYDNEVLVKNGNIFFSHSQHKMQYIRLSIASLDEDNIIKGIKKLGNALGTIYTLKKI